MTVARRASRELALVGGTAGSPHVPPSLIPARSRQSVLAAPAMSVAATENFGKDGRATNELT